MKEDYLQLRAGIDRLSHRLGRAPNVGEIATELDWCRDKVTQTLLVIHAYQPDQLDTATDGHEPGGWSFADNVGTEDQEYANVEHRLTVQPLIAALPARDRAVLTMRFFQEMTQTQIARKLGISQMHVSRILGKTLSQLREQAMVTETEPVLPSAAAATSADFGSRGDEGETAKVRQYSAPSPAVGFAPPRRLSLAG
jgi:RNA polymerase sigma-B factor